MKRIFPLALISILLLLQSCKKDRVTEEEPEDLSAFLTGRQQAFYGNISDSTVSWVFGPNFQMGHYAGVTTVSGIPEKILAFNLTAEFDLNTRMYISIPKYPVGSEDLFTRVVSVGEKTLGPQYDKFFFMLTLNTINYTTNGDQMGSKLKVLQMLKTTDGSGKDIVLVWFSLNCKFYDGLGKYAFSVQKGKFLASFMYNL
jgi:hypothetical protein